jgi:diguanylate cyclase (GGDEF)-like protein
MDKQYTELKQEVEQLTQQVQSYEQRLVELKHRSDIQDALNEMLNISLMPISLNDQMEKILLLVLNIPWLSLDKKGCIFLTDESGHGLTMVADHNLGSSLLTLCSHIQFGQCLCGKAAETKQLVFRNCIDHDHDIEPEGMQPHGHYNMPIISSGKTLGVLNLYVKHGHIASDLEQEFLNATAAAMANIIERKLIEEKLHDLSHIDELTGIANRRQFMKCLIQEASDPDNLFALLFIDLDHFKTINDTHGHDHGDQILISAVQRIQACLHETDLLARLGGDEFVVLLRAQVSMEKVIQIAEAIILSISRPYEIKDKILSLGASIGISLYPQHDLQVEGLLKKADKALYRAKENRGTAVFYNG